ncbi:enoyl-CoA hydratase-related protein [Paraburkholderia strydomiana]|uniref:enoyl-CoA hydratase-related protein n=1 Tax=Paraburkholderia strydomiana TaxID=1245417 RepID=UPI0038BB0E27
MENVTLDIEGQVATVTLRRPDAMNALNRSTKEALLAVLKDVSVDTSIRAVVPTGVGRAFCVGQDLSELRADLDTDGAAAWETVRDHYSPVVKLIATMPKPVIAALNGVAAGAGAAFALACDYRLSSATASINFAFASIGLSADSGATWTLPRLVGTARAKNLLMRPGSVDATACLGFGLIDEIVESDLLAGRAAALAAEFATGPTLAYAAIRQALVYSASHSLDETLALEEHLMRETGTSGDHREAIDSFLAKQKPVFRGGH